MAEIKVTGMQMSLDDWLDDLIVRFFLNLPESELAQMPRLCFQVEEAQWFYEDFIRPAEAAIGNQLPALPLRTFCLKLFQRYPPMSDLTDAERVAAYEEFLAYKVRVPVRGAILMDQSMEKLVLVKGWKKGASWSFPRGKINAAEEDLSCAIREVYEETGYDIREAGLVPENENEVKYIDIDIREQNMRLFVFRGVPVDTFFEPKTRKEISKIAWYNVRDLPGFKKQKGGAVQTGQANKFYMVAPFLGPLKRWINEQRRIDHAAAANEYAQPATDYEDVMEEYHEPPPTQPLAVQDMSDELRHLMGLAPAPPAQQVHQAPRATAKPQPPNDLLALLRGEPNGASSKSIPHTPYDQINPPPQQPQAPQVRHARQTSTGYQQPVPQFPFSPQRLQQQQQQQQEQHFQHFSGPLDALHNHGVEYHTYKAAPNLGHAPGINQPLVQHSQQMTHRTPISASLGSVHGLHNNGHFYPQPQVPVQPVYQHETPRARHQALPDNSAFQAQGSRGPIGSGPPVPRAEHLPMPKINAHSMQLLDAFKGARKPSAASGSHSGHGPRQSRQHENALLDLLKKPVASHTESESAQTAPVVTTEAERPTISNVRRPTLNEITRTLPTAKTTSPDIAVPPQMPPITVDQLQTSTEIPEGTPDASAANIETRGQESSKPSQSEVKTAPPGVAIIPRPTSTQKPRSPKPGQSHLNGTSTAHPPRGKQVQPTGSPRPKGNAKGRDNSAPSPAFTILPRPGSVRAEKSRVSPVPSSPLGKETSKPGFQPQVLRRPESVDPVTVQKAAEVVEQNNSNGQDKRDQLLALFGKRPVAAAPSPVALPSLSPPAAVTSRADGAVDDNSNLLNLFSGPTQTAAPASQPPSAPQLLPERRPSSQYVTATRQPASQNALLDLFKRPDSSGALNSPGTPISPFTLGTPATKQAPQQHWPNPAQQAFANATSQASELQRRESGLSTASTASAGGKGRQGSSGAMASPVEANRGFLLDYLNGVVLKEGHKGAKKM